MSEKAKRQYVAPSIATQPITGQAPLLLVTPPDERCCDGSPPDPFCPPGQVPGMDC